MRGHAWSFLLVLAAFATLAGSSPAARPRVTTLLTTDSPIRAFAQDGPQIAWASGRPCAKVRVRRAAGGSAAVLGDTRSATGCLKLEAFALAGGRVVWGGVGSCCRDATGLIATAAPGLAAKPLRPLRRPRRVLGDYVAASGDGDTLVVAWDAFNLLQGQKLDDSRSGLHCIPDPCQWLLTNAAAWTVEGTALRYLDAPPPAFVAAAVGRVAVVPAERRLTAGTCSNAPPQDCPRVRSQVDPAVRIKDPATGATVAAFQPLGRVTAVALDPTSAAVLVRAGTSARVERYDPATGAPLAARPVSPAAADQLDVDAGTIVYRVGRTIHVVDAATAKDVVVATARSTPVGLSIEGRRIAWAENAGKRGYVRQLLLRAP